MAKKNGFLLKYSVPLVALLIIAVQLFMVSEHNLTRWKGGGFGMYSEMHFNFNEVIVNNLDMQLDSIKKSDTDIANKVRTLKRIPNTANLKELAQLIASHSLDSTITVQVWRPLLDTKKARYSRELINEFHYVKP